MKKHCPHHLTGLAVQTIPHPMLGQSRSRSPLRRHQVGIIPDQGTLLSRKWSYDPLLFEYRPRLHPNWPGPRARVRTQCAFT
eukprot:scaffold69480_cov50-Attheya_sp.AAC.1